jgi:hypothetical protein
MPNKKETPGVVRAAKDLRKGGRDAGLAMEERRRILGLERKVDKLEKKIEKLESKPKPAPSRKKKSPRT